MLMDSTTFPTSPSNSCQDSTFCMSETRNKRDLCEEESAGTREDASDLAYHVVANEETIEREVTWSESFSQLQGDFAEQFDPAV